MPVSATIRQLQYVPGGAPAFAEQNAFASNQDIDNHGRNVAVSETHIFSDRTINQFQVGFNRIFNYISVVWKRQLRIGKVGYSGCRFRRGMR